MRPNEDEHLTSKQVWERVTKTVDPIKDGLAICKTRNLVSGDILISTENEADIAKLEAKLGSTNSNTSLSLDQLRAIQRSSSLTLIQIWKRRN